MVAVALAEKQEAADVYARLNGSAYDIAAAIPNTTLAMAVVASVEAGAYASGIVNAGWTVMLLGYAGDRAGGVYNVTGIRGAIAAYDGMWEGYRGLVGKFGPLAPGLMNDTCWQHPSTGLPGMGQSVDRYRHV